MALDKGRSSLILLLSNNRTPPYEILSATLHFVRASGSAQEQRVADVAIEAIRHEVEGMNVVPQPACRPGAIS